ncbi:COX15/CtaA family protein [Sphingomonas carotinifaciens]|uniref:Heme A synthase n=1 Tax=Sphingomonas carotinifaciens TaxID=1166323 RepID=A0A1G7EYG4_9SPHN|nr:COX15/CtaA family protein [Sphingomonas carotinifaciens]MBB4085805.1 cytochrome c oxidase assembly protein subunit 15 [Sphingomonas carotinifaciens]SDE68750.1 cytochrome c oxidase assembly protein subunit 15 [Sphingomonas carotinifaciens]
MLQPSAAFMSTARPRSIAYWLFGVAALIVAMVVVGGITRLTNSGLSITEWKPITGIVPPLNEAQWQAEFANYKRIPEYTTFNQHMTLAGFKAIFFWEYLHRVLGRVIGMAFALPLLWFWVRGRIPAGYKPRLVALLALGGLQGAIGWWMVASGLVERTDVSHIRLTVHLVTALVILAGIIWTAMDLMALRRSPLAAPARLTRGSGIVLALLFVQIVYGALTAGLDAGYAFASWPLMGDAWFPQGVPMASPALANAVDNPVVVQFIHRWFAFVAAAGLAWIAVRTARGGALRTGAVVLALVGVQIALGIATLLSGVQIDVAVAHQLNAALLLIATVAAAHRLGTPPAPLSVSRYPSGNPRKA